MTTPDWGEARSRQITWHDPLVGAQAAGQLSGREYLQAMIDGRFARPPIASLFGLELVRVGDGEAVFACTPDESLYNPIGMVHGGFLCTLLDSAAGCAVQSRLPAGTGYTSVEIKVSYLKAVKLDSGRIEAIGTVLRMGRRIGFAEAHARNAQGELVGHATSTIAILAG